MTNSMYQLSVPTFIHYLKNLDRILKKGEAHARARNIDPAVLVNSRLYPDMFPLARQVQIASDMAKNGASRLAGREPPKYRDTESTLPALRERVQRTLRYLRKLKRADIDGSEDRQIVLQFPGIRLEFKGRPYLTGFVLPNFYFHITTAYNILRHNGVEVGKMDFLGAPPTVKSPAKKKKKKTKKGKTKARR